MHHKSPMYIHETKYPKMQYSMQTNTIYTKGLIKHKQAPLSENNRDKIKLRDEIRQHNPKDTKIKTLNEEIDKLVTSHKT